MSTCSKLSVLAMVAIIASGWVVTPSARAATEDCIQCKHVDCIKGLIKQKTAMAAGYDALAQKWDPLVKVEGAPSDTVNFNTITDPAQRTNFYRDLLAKLKVLATQENELASTVGPPPGCGELSLEASTDTYATCKVDEASVTRAQNQAPCKQIAALIAKHENLHRNSCMNRKRTPGNTSPWKPDDWPYSVPAIMQTPAGHAREEAAAYRMEIGELKVLLPKAQAKCKLSFTGVTTSCTIPMPGAGSIEMGQDISGKVCGDPLTATWTINTISWVKGPYIGVSRNVDPPFDDDCVAKDSTEEARRAQILSAGPGAGWMCVYDERTPTKVIIRSFRLKQCSPHSEQTFVRDAARSECDDDIPAPPPTTPTTDVPVS
ncbi:MAG: hypothetical protein JWL98_1949 [Xanthomonadaceae bacterium]|nr:hypothetical protein [Xanthomonadaceae bacterium]